MKNILKAAAPVLFSLCLAAVCAPWLGAQITNQIRAHVDHSFIIGNKTLPPGDYTFRMEGDTNQGVIVVQNGRGDNVEQFAVRQSVDSHTPRHTELVFHKYGNTEFLTKIYEGGNKDGVAVAEISKHEAALMNGGQHGMEHTEEQH